MSSLSKDSDEGTMSNPFAFHTPRDPSSSTHVFSDSDPTEPASEMTRPSVLLRVPEEPSEPLTAPPVMETPQLIRFNDDVFEQFMEQSEYGPLSYVLSFLPVVEILPLRRASRFFQDVVRVALELRQIDDSELIDINLRFARYAESELRAKARPSMPYYTSTLKSEIYYALADLTPTTETETDTDTDTSSRSSPARTVLPTVFATCFGFLASTSRLSLLHVTSTIRWSTPVKKVVDPFTLLVSDSFLADDSSTRWSHFVWTMRICLGLIDYAFRFRDYSYHERNLFAFHEIEHSLSPVVDCLRSKEEEEVEEEGECTNSTPETAKISLRRGKVIYEVIRNIPTVVRSGCGGWSHGQMDALMDGCEKRQIIPLFPGEEWGTWVNDEHRIKSAEFFLKLVDKCPYVLQFFHESINSDCHRLIGWQNRKAMSLVIIEGLMARRSMPFVDPEEGFLKRVFDAPRGWQVEQRGGGKWRALKEGYSTDDSGMAQLIQDLMDKGHSVELTDRQRGVQLKGMIKANSKNAGMFLFKALGVTWKDQFVEGKTTPLMEIAKCGAATLIDLFVDKYGPEILHFRDAHGRNALHYAVLHKIDTSEWRNRGKSSDSATRKLFFLRRELASERDEFGATPLEYALQEGKYESAKYLLDQHEEEVAICWDMTRPCTSSTSIFLRIAAGRDVFEKFQENCNRPDCRDKLIFPNELRRQAFMQACGRANIDVATLIIPGVRNGTVTESTPDEEAIVTHSERVQILVRALECGSHEVARFILPTIRLDSQLAEGSPGVLGVDTDCRWPLFFAAFSKDEKLVEILFDSARKSARSDQLMTHFREIMPNVLLSLLKTQSGHAVRPTKTFALLKVLQPMFDILRDEDFESLVPIMREHSLSPEFFVLAASLSPEKSVTKFPPSDVPILVKQQVFCHALAMKNTKSALAVVGTFDAVTDSIPKAVIGDQAGLRCLLCHSCSPLCLALHADMPDLITAIISLLDDEQVRKTEIVATAKCLFSLQEFVLDRFNETLGAYFGILLGHCPDLVALLLQPDEDEEEEEGQQRFVRMVRGSEMKKKCLGSWVLAHSDKSSEILPWCEEFFSEGSD